MDSYLADLKESERGLRMNELSVKYILYTDDQVLLASSAEQLQGMVTLMNEVFKRKGMNVNVNKLKFIVFERDEDVLLCEIKINDVSGASESVCLSGYLQEMVRLMLMWNVE